MVRFFLIGLFCFLNGCILLSQNRQLDTILNLPLIEIAVSPDEHFSFSKPKRNLSSTTINLFPSKTLAEVFSLFSSTYVKNYGPGRLATTSIQGAAATHTAVIWNGLSLQSPILGQFDFSLLPIYLFDNIQLISGSNGAAAGSGAIGGSIELKSKAISQKARTQIDLKGGSFGQFFGGLKLETSKKSFSNTTRLFFQSAQNNFRYRNGNGEEVALSNAASQQLGLLQENQLALGNQDQLSLRIWAQQAKRAIPPTRFQRQSVAEQEDRALRSQIAWKHTASNFIQGIRLSHIYEQIYYQDTLAQIDSDTKTNLYQIENFWEFQFNSVHRLLFNVKGIFTTAHSSNYTGIPQRTQLASYLSYRFQPDHRWKAQLDLRQEMVDGAFVPFIPEFRLIFQGNKAYSIYTNISRFFRLPTFNDWYWATGGNPDLQAENGWGQELGFRWQRSNGSIQLNSFHKNIQDWIIWLPNGPFFSPENVQQVQIIGAELEGTYQKNWQQWQFLLSSNLQYTQSKNLKSKRPDDASIGKQLIYTPYWQGNAQLQLQYGNWQLHYVHSFTGKVFTSIDHSEHLASFHTAQLYLRKSWSRTYGSILFYATIENIWNEDYEVVIQRPMPRRSIEFGIQFKPSL